MRKLLITKQRGGLWARLTALMVVLMMITMQMNAQTNPNGWDYLNAGFKYGYFNNTAPEPADETSYNTFTASTPGFIWSASGGWITYQKNVDGYLGYSYQGKFYAKTTQQDILAVFKGTFVTPSYTKVEAKWQYKLGATRMHANYYNAVSAYMFDDEATAKSTLIKHDMTLENATGYYLKLTDGDQPVNSEKFSETKEETYSKDNSTGSDNDTIKKYITFMYSCRATGGTGPNGYVTKANFYSTNTSYNIWYYKYITFDANNGSGTQMENQTIETFNDGDGTALSANTYTRSNYVFMGWNTQPDGSGTSYADGAVVTATLADKGPVTLYAQWAVCVNTSTNVGYPTVQAAINAAENNHTVKMLANSTENVSVASGKTVTLDLNGFVLNQSTDNNGVIVSSGNLTIKDSDASKTNYFTYISNGAWTYLPDHTPAATDVALADIGTATLTSGETVISVPGGCITGGKATGYGGGVRINGDSFTLQGGNIIGNSVPNALYDKQSGGGVFVSSGIFNMQGGVIAGNNSYTGPGVCVNNYATLSMTGGKIISNYGGLGGGVNNDGTIIMTGGEIAYNTGFHGGGGVRAFGNKTVGGTARIINNTTDGTNANNFFVCTGTITVSSSTPLSNGANIGVTAGTPTVGNPVTVTSDCAASDVQYFKSDNAAYTTIYDDSKVKLAVIGSNVCKIVETGNMFETVAAAITAAGNDQTVQMLANSTENVSVASGKTVTLDLNGFVLNQSTDNNGVIVSSGNLTIKDSDASKTNYFTYMSNGAWTYLPDHTPAATDVALADIGTATLTSGETVISVPGGCITGGKATGYGGGVKVSGGSVTLQSGNIIGNSVPNGSGEWKGGGVCVCVNSGTFNMQGGVIVGNNAYTGGGVQINGTLNMTGGKIIANSAGLGGGVNNDGTITMTGGEIAYNSGGCGGVRGFGTKTVGGTARIINNKDDGNTSNFVVCSGTITVSSSTPLTNGAIIGVTPPTAPTVGNPVAVTSNCAASDVQYFKSDNAAYAPIYNDSKVKLAVIGSNVCKLVETGVMYETIDAAISAATAGQTVQLLRSMSVGNQYVNKSITLDLGGFTVSGNYNCDALLISSGATVRFTNGTIHASSNKSCCGVFDETNGGTLYVDHVNLTGFNAFYAIGGDTYFGEGVNCATASIYSSNGNGHLHITDGIYESSVLDCVTIVPSTDKLFLSGGCFKYNTFSTHSINEYLKLGYTTTPCTHGHPGYTDVVFDDSQLVAIVRHTEGGVVTETKFGKLADAVSAATSGEEVILTKDTQENVTIPIGKTITLDLNGKVLSATSGTVITNNGTLTLTDGVGGGKVTGGAKGVMQNGTLTVGGKLNVTGNTENLYLPANKFATVSSTTPLINGAHIGVTTQTAPTVGNPVAVTTNNSESVMQYFTSDNGSFLVIEDNNKAVQLAVPVAQIGDDRYATVQAAIDAAEDGQTVQMLNNTTESVTMASKKAITLDLNGKTIASKDKGTVIANNGTLTVIDSSDGNGIIKGAETGAGIVNSSTGTLNLYAGEVKDNVRGVDNGGTLTLGGKVLITSNGTDTTKDNLYMRDNTTFSIATGENAPAETMHISITTETAPTANNDIPLTDANENYLDHSKHFFGDNSAYTVFYGNDKKLYLTNDVTIIVTADPDEGGEAQLLVTATGEPVENPEHIHYGTMVTIKVTSVEQGWAFKGWYDKSTGNMFSGKFEYTFDATKNLELEARFTDAVIWVRVKKGN